MLLSIMREGIVESFWSVLILLAILTPIMIFFEYSRHYQLLERISRYFSWLTRWLTLSPTAAFPLVIGMFFGILFSAAVLIEFSRQKLISGRDMILLGTFLSLNHSIVEDNLLFAAVGANFPMLLFSRFALAVFVTRTMAWWIDSKKPSPEVTSMPANDQ